MTLNRLFHMTEGLTKQLLDLGTAKIRRTLFYKLA